ncbi:MAG TPA: MBOAT family protein [Fimbriimonas sp.]|nr:MBOAT family protein [Fimbriimonas sp.]
MAEWIALLMFCVVLPVALATGRQRSLAQLGLAAAGATLLVLHRSEPPAFRLLACTFLLLYLMKGLVLLAVPRDRVRATRALPFTIFFSVWPGMSLSGLQRRRKAEPEDVQGFGRGLIFAYTGGAILSVDALLQPHLSLLQAGAIAVVGILLTVHFGISEVLTAGLRFLGWPVEPLFRQPERSQSLEDFWGRRWNLPFVEMDRRLFVRPLVRGLGPQRATFAVFMISGLFHEMAISYPAGAGWGLPLTYFVVQAIGNGFQSRGMLKGRLWTYVLVLLPLPLLFHPAFLKALPGPMIVLLHDWLAAHPLDWYMNILLWVLGVVQLLPLAASFQVPNRLNWKEELPKLSPFNRKLMWTYGAFVVLTILSFSVLTLSLHHEMLNGDRAAVAFATFAAVYWGLRLLVDAVYLKADGWPRGAEFAIGHGLLASLFAFLALGYAAVVVRSFWR